MSAGVAVETERSRLAELHEYGVLDAPADDELEAVVRVAAMVAGVPTATLNLIDEDRQCQLTTVGFDGGDSARSDSMCAVRLHEKRFIHVPDASRDSVYAANPWVTGALANVRFYASAPLVTPAGYALGTLCVFDGVPKDLTDEQAARLSDLAQVVVALFERRRVGLAHAEMAVAAERRQRELDVTVAELQRSNSELSNFAGVVSHDLLSPLGVVNGYLELLDDMYVSTLDAQAGKWLTTARRAVTRMRHLVEALLAYSRAGSAPLRARPTDLGQVLDEALIDLRDNIREAGATIAIETTLPTVNCDPTLIRQLLQNLVGNAVKYRHPDRRSHVAVTATTTDAGVTVSVADNGIGIPAEHRRSVFMMFSQVDPAAAKGNGIGLSTCQRIVDRHGGRIRIDDTPGGGTTVSVTLNC